MMTTWILVSNQTHGLLFSREGSSSDISLLKRFENPTGRAHEGDLVTGSKGEVFQRAAQGQRRATEAEVSAKDHNAQVFAGSLAREMRDGRVSDAYEQLVLVAAPGFLGELRNALDEPTAKCIVQEEAKNLAQQSLDEIETALVDLLK